MISFWKFGPYFSPDTTNYFLYAQDMQGQKELYGSAYSPAYPFLLSLCSYFGIGQITWSAIMALIIYGVNLLFTVKIAQLLGQRLSNPKRQYLIFLPLVFLHAWWSFRMCTWAHADSLFYACLMTWLYFGLKLIKSPRIQPLLIFSLLSTALILTKLNGIVLIPFFAVLVIWEFKTKWIFPLTSALLSYLAYQYFYPDNVFSNPFAQDNWFSLWDAELAFRQIGEIFRVSLGFVFSDFLSAKIPALIAFPGGMIMVAGLIWATVKTNSRKNTQFFLLLFSNLYLLCLLAFQHVIGFEEINYRTLFPYFWTLFWAFIIWIGEQENPPLRWTVLLAFFLFAHTMTGHILYFNKTHHNSLFEARAIESSYLFREIQKVRDQFSAPPKLYSDHPEMLSFILDNAPVNKPFPKTYFEAGKTRLLPPSQQIEAKQLFKEQLKNGNALLVLFKPDSEIHKKINLEGLTIKSFPKAELIFKKK